MAANNIQQIATSNTFQIWFNRTQSLITSENLLTDGQGSTFYANTILEVGGTDAQLNVRTSGEINTFYANTANINGNANVDGTLDVTGDVDIRGDLVVGGNITLDAAGFDELTVGGNAAVTTNVTAGNIIITNAVTTDELRITSNIDTARITNSLEVGTTANVVGDMTIGGDLTVTGNITLDSVGYDDMSIAGNVTVSTDLDVSGNTTLQTANIDFITGNALTQFDLTGEAVALSIALG